jgi:hypothetical protein
LADIFLPKSLFLLGEGKNAFFKRQLDIRSRF